MNNLTFKSLFRFDFINIKLSKKTFLSFELIKLIVHFITLSEKIFFICIAWFSIFQRMENFELTV